VESSALLFWHLVRLVERLAANSSCTPLLHLRICSRSPIFKFVEEKMGKNGGDEVSGRQSTREGDRSGPSHQHAAGTKRTQWGSSPSATSPAAGATSTQQKKQMRKNRISGLATDAAEYKRAPDLSGAEFPPLSSSPPSPVLSRTLFRQAWRSCILLTIFEPCVKHGGNVPLHPVWIRLQRSRRFDNVAVKLCSNYVAIAIAIAYAPSHSPSPSSHRHCHRLAIAIAIAFAQSPCHWRAATASPSPLLTLRRQLNRAPPGLLQQSFRARPTCTPAGRVPRGGPSRRADRGHRCQHGGATRAVHTRWSQRRLCSATGKPAPGAQLAGPAPSHHAGTGPQRWSRSAQTGSGSHAAPRAASAPRAKGGPHSRSAADSDGWTGPPPCGRAPSLLQSAPTPAPRPEAHGAPPREPAQGGW
jgi:hypothetical protein